jgi:hypothetical protein
MVRNGREFYEQGEMPDALKALESGVDAAEAEQVAAAASGKRLVICKVVVAADLASASTSGRTPGKLGNRSPFRQAPPAKASTKGIATVKSTGTPQLPVQPV